MSTIEKATDVLFFLRAQPAPCGVTAIASGLGIPKASAHRLLQSLRHRSLVERDGRNRYGLGVGLVALGLGASGRDPLVRAARPFMEQYCQQLGETFFLVRARGGKLVVVDKVEGRGFLRASPNIGSTVPVEATAVGRVFRAFAPDLLTLDSANAVGARPRSNTKTASERAVQRALSAGYATSQDEWVAGLSAVAAPVLVDGQMLGAIAVALASARFRELGADQVSDAARSAATSVSERLEGKT